MKKPLSPSLVRLFALLLFIAVGSAVYLLIPNKTNAPTPQQNQSNVNTQQKNLQVPTLPNSTIQENSAIKSATTTPELLSATLKTPDRSYSLKFKPGTILLDAMRQLTAQSIQPFIFSGKEYTQLGFFVEEINGTKNDPRNSKYWIYYINGEPAQIGISNYKLKQNDLIEWKYERSKF